MVQTWVILAALMAAAPAEPEPEPAVKPAARWQYAELHSRTTPARSAADGTLTPAKFVISWDTSGGTVSAESWEELAKKLKTPMPGKDAGTNHRLRVLDRLGAQGWELVGVDNSQTRVAAGRAAAARAANTWLFKRRILE